MRKILAVMLCLSGTIGSAGCFRASISTGATPSTQVIEKSFASGWIYGLVPPSTVETAAKCPNGVAKVETQLSFLNQLVGSLTFGIYTPMSIKVTCAAAKTSASATITPDVTVGAGAGGTAVQDAFAQAADRAVRDGKAVLVQVTP